MKDNNIIWFGVAILMVFLVGRNFGTFSIFNQSLAYNADIGDMHVSSDYPINNQTFFGLDYFVTTANNYLLSQSTGTISTVSNHYISSPPITMVSVINKSIIMNRLNYILFDYSGSFGHTSFLGESGHYSIGLICDNGFETILTASGGYSSPSSSSGYIKITTSENHTIIDITGTKNTINLPSDTTCYLGISVSADSCSRAGCGSMVQVSNIDINLIALPVVQYVYVNNTVYVDNPIYINNTNNTITQTQYVNQTINNTIIQTQTDTVYIYVPKTQYVNNTVYVNNTIYQNQTKYLNNPQTPTGNLMTYLFLAGAAILIIYLSVGGKR